jgi:hypothetical protein
MIMTEAEKQEVLYWEKKIEGIILPNSKPSLAFVHIPKNAGTTVMRTMFQRQKGIGGHLTATMINSIEKYKDLKSFMICREPFDRFLSVYLWRLRKDELIQKMSLEEVIERLEDSEIRQPIKYGFESDEYKLDRMFLKQTCWMNDNTVYVGRTENVNKHMLNLRQQYSLGFPWSKTEQKAHHNKGKDYSTVNPSKTRANLIKILNNSDNLRNSFFDYYGVDYQKFGYNTPKEIK